VPAPVQAQKAAEPLFWADGITRADELEAYSATGLNTVVVRLFWQPSPDGSLNPDDLEPQRQFAQAAARRGLKIIYALPAAPATLDSGFRVSAASKAYFEVWTTWITGAMDKLKDTPNLVGWALPDDPRDLPFTDELGWQKWLHENFASVGFINGQWKAAFPTLEDASLQSVEAMISNYRGAPLPFEAGSNEQMQALAQRASQKPDPSWLFHPAALALAHYKWDAYRALLSSWADVVTQNDASHPIFSGRLPDYAQLLSLPPSISVAVPDLEPGVAEGDAVTHNPQAIAMARRGGRFKAIPTLLTHGSNAVPGQLIPALMPRWIQAAQINGAGGVCFASWSDILADAALRDSVTRALSQPRNEDWNLSPIATAAVVISPLADGHTLQIGMALPSRPRGLYGFGEDMVPGEPSDLAYALRWGTAFGSVDFLSVDDLAPDGSTLARYSTVLLPCALSLSLDQSSALSNYVRGGGVLVADMGAGALQAGGSVSALPPSLASLFGVAPLMSARHTSFNLQLLAPNPLLPTWSSLSGGRVGTQLTRGLGNSGAAFEGLTGYALPMSSTQMVAMGDQWLQPLPRNANGVRPPRIMRSGLLANTQNGTAFYAPWLLWSTWRPGAVGFDAFHGDLLARNAALAAAGAASLVPEPLGVEEPLWAPVVNYADGVAIFNPNPRLQPVPPPEPGTQSSALSVPGALAPHRNVPNPYGTQPRAPRPTPVPETPAEAFRNAASQTLAPGTLAARVQTSGVGDFVWGDALALFDPSAPFGVVGGRPAPIANPSESEQSVQAVTLQVLVAPGEARQARLLPIRAQNLNGGTLMTYGARYDERGIKLSVWPNANQSTIRGGEYSIMLAAPGPMRLTFYPGRYAIAPRSRHRVTLSITGAAPAPAQPPTRNHKTQSAPAAPPSPILSTHRTFTQVLTADEHGQFKVEATGALLTVEVAPVEG